MAAQAELNLQVFYILEGFRLYFGDSLAFGKHKYGICARVTHLNNKPYLR